MASKDGKECLCDRTSFEYVGEATDEEALAAGLVFDREGDSSELRCINRELTEENGKLRKSVLNQCGDNLCWFKPNGEPCTQEDMPIPSADEFLESCRRYHQQITERNGTLAGVGCMTIAQLEAALQSTRDELAGCAFRNVAFEHHVKDLEVANRQLRSRLAAAHGEI